MLKGNHLVFYDGECGLCDHFVQFLLKRDHRKQFLFAPLQGEAARNFLKEVPEEVRSADSVLLIENYQTEKKQLYIYGKAAFRILWLLGGPWKLIGWKNFLPAILYDWGYWIVAKNRKKFFPQISCVVPTPEEKERFLP